MAFNGQSGKKVSRETKEKAIELLRAGELNPSAIAQRLGISISLVRRFAREAGLVCAGKRVAFVVRPSIVALRAAVQKVLRGDDE